MKHPGSFLLFYSLFFLTITAFSCKKEKTLFTKAQGIVVESGSLKPVPDATVKLMRSKNSCFSCQAGTVEVTTSDAQGNFSFEFTADEEYSYSLGAIAHKHFELSGDKVYIDIGEKNDKMLILSPEAYLKVFIKNTTPYDYDDLIGIGGGWGGSPHQYSGTLVDTSKIHRVIGNSEIIVNWTVIKNNISNKYSILVNCPDFDTAIYHISY